MFQRTSVLFLAATIVVTAGCAKQDQTTVEIDPVAEAWESLGAAWGEAETAEEKTALAEDFLARFPDSEHAGSMAGAIAYYRGVEMNEPEGAVATLNAALPKITDPEQRFEVAMEALAFSDSVEVPYSLTDVAGELAALQPLTYSQNEWVAETAIDLEQWDVADAHANAALVLATPEVYRADYPERDFSDEDLADRAARRRAMALAHGGWAQHKMGNSELAFSRFATADEAGSVSYLGVPNTPLYEYWGRAELDQGEIESAIELLGLHAIFGEDGSSAMPFLRQAYAAKNGSEEGFNEFLWETRIDLAPTIDDFELLDYDGNPFRLSDVGDKVVLLAFWFPT
ncbi:MAG: hypothetical protein PVG92_05570 [Holophagae bacterium]|jgi:hypothetical protein